MNDTSAEFRNLTLGYNGHAAVHHLCGGVKRGSLTPAVLIFLLVLGLQLFARGERA